MGGRTMEVGLLQVKTMEVVPLQVKTMEVVPLQVKTMDKAMEVVPRQVKTMDKAMEAVPLQDKLILRLHNGSTLLTRTEVDRSTPLNYRKPWSTVTGATSAKRPAG